MTSLQVEEQYRAGGQEVMWYVVSDCAALRGKAAERYGARVLVPRNETPVEHLAFSSGDPARDVLAFRVAFAEQWLLGMTDFQVCFGFPWSGESLFPDRMRQQFIAVGPRAHRGAVGAIGAMWAHAVGMLTSRCTAMQCMPSMPGIIQSAFACLTDYQVGFARRATQGTSFNICQR